MVAPMRFATKRCSSGWTVRSLVATMYQLGLDFQATPAAFLVNSSAAGAKLVAQTTFCSCSGKSPAKQATPSGFIQTRPSATSMCENTPLTGNLSNRLCDVSLSSGGKCSDVNQSSDSLIRARCCDDRPAVRVPHQNRRAADAPERAFDRGNVAFVGI